MRGVASTLLWFRTQHVLVSGSQEISDGKRVVWKFVPKNTFFSSSVVGVHTQPTVKDFVQHHAVGCGEQTGECMYWPTSSLDRRYN